jgi:transcriptional regulator with XRE-family HTH domain
MPAAAPAMSDVASTKLQALGMQIRARRKQLGISANALAEAAGLSRVTLHRIEKSAPAVTMAAYLNVIAALGLDLGFTPPPVTDKAPSNTDYTGWIPARVRLVDYPQLRQLAWQLQSVDTLTPTEALGIYERNWRHVDVSALEPREQQLVDALRLGLGESFPHV